VRRACNIDVININQNADSIRIMMINKKRRINLGRRKSNLQKSVAKGVKPLTRGLFKAIDSLIEVTN